VSADRRAASKKEAPTYRNGVWDRDLNNDGTPDTDEIKYTRTDAPWVNFTGDNTDGTNETMGGGKHGFDENQLPHYPTDRLDQGAVTGANGDWQRDPRFLNGILGGSMRQPHEEFLNLDYVLTNLNTASAWPNGNSGVGAKLDYRKDHEVTHKTAGTPDAWTTRARDADGGLVTLSLNINGVMYFEGNFTGNGNMKIYGSMLMRRSYDASGSLEVWFNEGLVKGDFPPVEWDLPRVYATAREQN